MKILIDTGLPLAVCLGGAKLNGTGKLLSF